MEKCRIFPFGSCDPLKFVVVFAHMDGQWLFVRHKRRETWETAGGHIEPGETAEAAARRELFEEAGATEFTIRPAFDYWACDAKGASFGAVFLAEVSALTPQTDYEMAECGLFNALPSNVTYPDITPMLFDAIRKLP